MDDAAHLPYSKAGRTPPNHSSCGFAHLLAMALGHARRLGLSRDDASDCAIQFVEKIWSHGTPHDTDATPPDQDEAWLRVCLKNHTLDFVRRRRTLCRHECQSLSDECACEPGKSSDMAGSCGPEEALYRGLIREQIERALRKTALDQRDLFVRHFVDGEDLPTIAAASGRSVNALRQSLFLTRRRIRAALQRTGWTEQDLRDCLAPPPARNYSDRNQTIGIVVIDRSGKVGPNTSRRSSVTSDAGEESAAASSLLHFSAVGASRYSRYRATSYGRRELMYRCITSTVVLAMAFLFVFARPGRAQASCTAASSITAPTKDQIFYTDSNLDPNYTRVTCSGTGSVAISHGIANHSYTVSWGVDLYESTAAGEGLAEHDETSATATTDMNGYWYNSASLMAPNVEFALGDHELKLNTYITCINPNMGAGSLPSITFHVLMGS